MPTSIRMSADDNANTLRDNTPRTLDFAEALKPSRCKVPSATRTPLDTRASLSLSCDALESASSDQDQGTHPGSSPTPTPSKCGTKYDPGSETTMSSPETCGALPPSFITSTSFQFDQDQPASAPHTSPSSQPPAPDQQAPPQASKLGSSLHVDTSASTSNPEPSPTHPGPDTPTCQSPDPPSELRSLSPQPYGSFSFLGFPGADPDGHLARQLLLLQSPQVPGHRFQVEDITCNSRLQEAARRELRPKPGEQSALRELEHLQAALEATDADAGEESRVNREVAELVVQRLEDGRRSLHRLVRLLQGLLAAESAYVTAMQNVSQFLASDDYVPCAQPQQQQQQQQGPGGGARRSGSGGGAGLYSAAGTPPPSRRTSMAGGQFQPGDGFAGASTAGRLSPAPAPYTAGLGYGEGSGGFFGVEPGVGGGFRAASGSSQVALTWALSACSSAAVAAPLPPLALRLASARSAPVSLSRSTSASSQGGLPAGPPPGSPSDPASPVECLLSSFSHLPELIAQSHRHLHSSLASLVADCQRLEGEIAEACEAAAPEAAAAAAAVDAARHALSASFSRHAGACRSFDVVLRGGDVKGRLAVELDPWATEGGAARSHQALQQAQEGQRRCLQRAFLRAQALESERLALSKQAVAAAAGSYRAALLPVQHDLVGLTDGAAAADTGVQLGKLAAAAAAGADIASQLTAQQAAYMSEVRSSLFSSPEIVLQGPLQLLDSPVSQWKSAHFVLTCAGFLHWFRSKEQGLDEPLGSLGLAHCRFEAGTQHTFHVLEARRPGPAGWLLGPGRPHRYSFQAEREECCGMWVAGVKQAIMLATGKW